MVRALSGLSVLAAILCLAAGCAVDQAKEVATYRKVLDAGARPVDYDPAGPLSLDNALQLANRHNERLAIQGENYLQSLIDKDRAVAAFLPTVSFAPSYLREERTRIPGAAPFVPERALDLPLEAGVNVNPLSSGATVRASREEAKRRREVLLEARSAVLLDVSEAYYQILRSEAQQSFLAGSVTVQQARLENVQKKRKAGAARALDIAQVEGQLAGTRAQLIAADTDVRNGRSVLALACGVSAVNGSLVDRLSVPDNAPTIDELYSAARTSRHDLKAVAKQVDVARRNVDAAWGRYFPTIGLGGEFWAKRQTFPPDVTWMGMVSVNWPIFSAGLIHDEVRTAFSQLRQAELAESYQARTALKELRVARENYVNSARRIAELRVQVAASEEALRDAEKGYQSGLNTNVDRLVAQDQVLASGLNLLSEELTRKVYYLRLLRAEGRLDFGCPELDAPSAPAGASKDRKE